MSYRDLGQKALVVLVVLGKLEHFAGREAIPVRLPGVQGDVQLVVIIVVLKVFFESLFVLTDREQGQVVELVVTTGQKKGTKISIF